MKTQVTCTRKLCYATILLFAICMFSPIYGQSNETTSTKVAQNEKTIKGIVSNADGPLKDVNVIVQGSKTGTVTNDKGEFTLYNLKTGDVIILSYLGYQTSKLKIKDNTTFIRATMTEEVVEFMGALNTDKRYKSKRKKQ